MKTIYDLALQAKNKTEAAAMLRSMTVPKGITKKAALALVLDIWAKRAKRAKNAPPQFKTTAQKLSTKRLNKSYTKFMNNYRYPNGELNIIVSDCFSFENWKLKGDRFTRAEWQTVIKITNSALIFNAKFNTKYFVVDCERVLPCVYRVKYLTQKGNTYYCEVAEGYAAAYESTATNAKAASYCPHDSAALAQKDYNSRVYIWRSEAKKLYDIKQIFIRKGMDTMIDQPAWIKTHYKYEWRWICERNNLPDGSALSVRILYNYWRLKKSSWLVEVVA